MIASSCNNLSLKLSSAGNFVRSVLCWHMKLQNTPKLQVQNVQVQNLINVFNVDHGGCHNLGYFEGDL